MESNQSRDSAETTGTPWVTELATLVHFADEIAQVRDSEEFGNGPGRVHKMLVKHTGLRVALVVMKAGNQWTEHKTQSRTSVQPAVGRSAEANCRCSIQASWHSVEALEGGVSFDTRMKANPRLPLDRNRFAVDGNKLRHGRERATGHAFTDLALRQPDKSWRWVSISGLGNSLRRRSQFGLRARALALAGEGRSLGPAVTNHENQGSVQQGRPGEPEIPNEACPLGVRKGRPH